MMRFDRTLVIAPHPDDDVIAAGGLIQRVLANGGEVHVLFVTDGENNPWPQRWMQKKWRLDANDRAAWGALRRDEAYCSLGRLSVPAAATTFLGFPDQRIGALIRAGNMELLQSMRKVVTDFQPTAIVTPSSRDLHSDHRAIAWCAHVAAAGETAIATYVIHGHAADCRLAERIELTESEQRRKRAAIECHHSQLLLSRERFLAHAGATESFYKAEYDLIGVPSAARERLSVLRHALHVVIGNHNVLPPPQEQPSGVQPAADVQDRPGDVPGLL